MTESRTDHTLLIAEYTLGLLNPAETAQAQRLLGSDPQALTDALKWEQALLELTDRLTPAQLSDSLWEEIATALDMDATAMAAYPLPLRPEQPVKSNDRSSPAPQPQPVAMSMPVATAPAACAPPTTAATSPAPTPTVTPTVTPTTPNRQKTAKQPAHHPATVGGWRLQPKHLGLPAGLLVISVLASRFFPGTPAAPAITILQVAPTQAAILQAPGHSSTPGWVVTVTPQGDVLLHPQVQTQVPDQASVQLWTYSLGQPEPRSLGLIDPNLPVTVPASLMGAIAPDQMFEMTQEPQGGSVSSVPSGAVLFIGRVVTFGQPVPAPPTTTNSSANL